jgi:hypothetical protein
MPNNNSWNGKWSGENDLYAKAINFGRSKKANEKALEILEKGIFYYNFGDGWSAKVSATEIDSKESAKVKKWSKGFLGYDWMIESIQEKGFISGE